MHVHPYSALPLVQFQCPGNAWHPKVPVVTTDTPCELAFASNDETASAALHKGLVGVEIQIEYQHGCVRS